MYGSSAKGLKTALKWGSETERRYYYGVLKSQGEYEAETIEFTPEYFAPKDKHRYTPDYKTSVNSIVNETEMFGYINRDRPVYHEVKGSYRLGSQDGARLRWCMAAISRPEAIFVWAKERKDRRWDIEIWYDGGRTQLKERGVIGYKFNEAGGVVWQR